MARRSSSSHARAITWVGVGVEVELGLGLGLGLGLRFGFWFGLGSVGHLLESDRLVLRARAARRLLDRGAVGALQRLVGVKDKDESES